jgi:hypothetical protein
VEGSWMQIREEADQPVGEVLVEEELQPAALASSRSWSAA